MSNPRKAVFLYLAGMNRTDGAPVKVSVGTITNGVVDHDAVVVHEAPPRITREIVTTFDLVTLRADGLYIPLRKES